MPATHVVFGAGGPLGQAVIERLLAESIPVRAVYRRSRGQTEPGVTEVIADMTDPEQVSRACEGAEVVYHCANAPYTEWPEKLPPMMQGLIQGLADSQARLVYADNLYCYGHVRGPIHEGLPSKPDTVKGRVRAEVADRLMNAHQQDRLRAAIVRSSDFYGPGVVYATLGRGIFEKILAGRKADFIGHIDQPHSYAYTKDFAAGLVNIGLQESAMGEVWHLPCDEALSAQEFVALAAEIAKTDSQATSMPKFLFAVLSRLVPILREYREMLYEFNEPFIINSDKYEARFGRKLTPHRQAIADTLDWVRNN